MDLRPTVLDDLGLGAAVRWYAETRLEEQGLEVSLEIAHPTPTLPKHIELSLFRVIQEAVTNIAKHANARHARIQLAFSDSTVKAVISDDGSGFDMERMLERNSQFEGLGLMGMQERVGLLGGRIQFQAHHGIGTEVSIEIPITQETV